MPGIESLTVPNRALISVTHKDDIVAFGRDLVERDWTLVSTGGTAKKLEQDGLPVTDVADLTGFPEMLSDRVKTLHPKVHGGLLADPADPEHEADIAEHGLIPFGLLVVDLYPFAKKASEGLPYPDVNANIDIGGPAMIRGAAKNGIFPVLSTPEQRPEFLRRLSEGTHNDPGYIYDLGTEVFKLMTRYDGDVLAWRSLSGTRDAAIEAARLRVNKVLDAQ